MKEAVLTQLTPLPFRVTDQLGTKPRVSLWGAHCVPSFWVLVFRPVPGRLAYNGNVVYTA